MRAGEEPARRRRHHAPLHLYPRLARHCRDGQARLDRLHPHAQPRHRRALRARAALHAGRDQGLMATILITGAGRGLGLELARQYLEDGWRVIGTVRGAATELSKLGAERLELDVTDTDRVKELSSKLKGVPIDVVF